MSAKAFRWASFAVVTLGVAAASCAGDAESTGPVTLRVGEQTPLEVAVPAHVSADKTGKGILLELKQVVLPPEVSGMRVFLVVPSGDGGSKTEYVTSVSRGQTSQGNPVESFAIELNRALHQSAKQPAAAKSPATLKLLLEPILRPSQNAADPVRVGDVAVRLE